MLGVIFIILFLFLVRCKVYFISEFMICEVVFDFINEKKEKVKFKSCNSV